MKTNTIKHIITTTAVNDIKTIDYYANENKLTINTSTDSYDFNPAINVIPKRLWIYM